MRIRSQIDGFTKDGIPSNYAGVPHLAGWGCELGAVCCSPGAMIAADEAPSTGPCGLKDPVPPRVGERAPEIRTVW